MRTHCESSGSTSRWLLLFSMALALAIPAALGIAAGTEVTDRAVETPAPYEAEAPVYGGVESTSRHVTMRDGVKIAITLYLPQDLPEGTKLPTILWQTRYWRAWKLRWPFSLFADRTMEPVAEFVTRGYAWLSVDARGSGASFGNRPYPWSPDETRDGAELVDWILAQPWSNGKVGSYGTSYMGTTAEFLVVNQHPAVVAVAPRFSLFDGYADIAFPGGAPLAWFTENWGNYNRMLDGNELPPQRQRDLRLVDRLRGGRRPAGRWGAGRGTPGRRS